MLSQPDNLVSPFRRPDTVAQQLRMDDQELEAHSTTVENVKKPGPSEGKDERQQHQRKWVATRETWLSESRAEEGIDFRSSAEGGKARARSRAEGGPDLVSRHLHYLFSLVFVSRPRDEIANFHTDSLRDSFLSLVISDA